MAPQSEPTTADLAARERRDRIPRYTIVQKDASIYFMLAEDNLGAWVAYCNHNAIVSKLEDRIAAAEARVLALTQERDEAERTLKSLATMLGWGNVPPRETLERDIAALKARADALAAAEARVLALTQSLQSAELRVDRAMERAEAAEAALATLQEISDRDELEIARLESLLERANIDPASSEWPPVEAEGRTD